jgi:acyl-CoA synthetase (AMP-forming)/AMP-acid ligase II/acyl carrier protein
MKNKIDIPLLASNNFDISLFELFLPLLSGGRATMIDYATLKDVNLIIRELRILNSFHAVPALMEQIVDAIENQNIKEQFYHIKKIFVGGEAVSTSLLRKIKNVFINSDLYVLYGPTETTIFTTVKAIKNIPDTSSHLLGSPLPNTSILILDENQKLVPVGVVGKIFISGSGLAKGYLHNQELTDIKFVSNPYSLNEKMYDSGDLGRWLPDGVLEFFGRSDNQVKIRGFRIELGEIENALLGYSENLKQTIIIAKEIHEQKVLVAYYMSNLDIDKSDLRLYLAKKIPEYAIPSFYVKLDKFPLTPNGKIDFKSLPDILDTDLIKREYQAPENEDQVKLIEIWENVLGINKIGINDNFFELGGNSINMIKITAEIQNHFELKINITDVFKDPTIKRLDDLIKNQIWYNQELTSNTVSDKITI